MFKPWAVSVARLEGAFRASVLGTAIGMGCMGGVHASTPAAQTIIQYESADGSSSSALKILRYVDPDLPMVQCYVSVFDDSMYRPFAFQVAGQTLGAVCRTSAPIVLKDDLPTQQIVMTNQDVAKYKHQVFHISRIVDRSQHTLLYQVVGEPRYSNQNGSMFAQVLFVFPYEMALK